MNIRDRDHEIINPLNNILMLVFGTPQFKEIQDEIDRVVEILERERVITRRRGRNRDSDIDND